MLCKRCGGLSVMERFCDSGEQGTYGWFWGQRCVNCGAIEDTIIDVNRAQVGKILLPRRRRRIRRHW